MSYFFTAPHKDATPVKDPRWLTQVRYTSFTYSEEEHQPDKNIPFQKKRHRIEEENANILVLMCENALVESCVAAAGSVQTSTLCQGREKFYSGAGPLRLSLVTIFYW